MAMTEREMVNVRKAVKQSRRVAGVKAGFEAACGIEPTVEVLGREDAVRITMLEDRHKKTTSRLGIV